MIGETEKLFFDSPPSFEDKYDHPMNAKHMVSTESSASLVFINKCFFLHMKDSEDFTELRIHGNGMT